MEQKIVEIDVANLWTAYINNSMAVCVNSYAAQTITDAPILNIFEKALELAKHNVQAITEIFNKENFPIPVGLTYEDVNLNAPRLFSDEYLLFYLHEMAILGLSAYALGLSTAHRLDVRSFYSSAYAGASEMNNSTLELMLSKGLLERIPTITLPQKAEFVEKQSFLAGWFGAHRPLNVIEIQSLYFNLKKSIMTKALALGFSQTAQSDEVRSFMRRVFELADQHIDQFRKVLHDDFVSSAISWDTHVTDSQIAPFSDKLMMLHGGFLVQSAIAYYGTAFSSSMRRDLSAQYAAAIARDTKVAEDGLNIMIANSWFEQPPQTINRKELTKV